MNLDPSNPEDVKPRVPGEPLHALLVEDSESDAMLVLRELRRGFGAVESLRVESASALRTALEGGRWDVVLCDWSLPEFSAIEAIAVLKEARRDVPLIIVSGTIGEESAVDAMRAGARDYVLKDKLSRLVPAVERECRESQSAQARKAAEHALRTSEATLKRTEEQLRQAQKMEAIGILAGGVAHDFNNILTVILSYTEMLLADLPAHDPVRADINEIHTAGERATALTRQLLAFSRQQIIEPRVLSWNDVLLGMDKMLHRLIREDVKLVVSTSPGLGKMKGDAGQLEQIVMNLVVNARDAMPDGGRLTLETSNIDFDDEHVRTHLGLKPGHYVMLTVSDTGVGIDKANQARIFEPFFTTKAKGHGTGLGLSTVFGIVEQSGGSIWVYSEPGRGTTFKVYLPRTDDTAVSLEPPPDVTTLKGTETLLLVEDEDQIRIVAKEILERHGYTVMDARNAGEALLACEQHEGVIDLLVTDVVMPQMNGKQLSDRLRPLRPKMKVLFLSGYTDGALVGELSAGSFFLQKPITPSTLTRKVREVLGVPNRTSPP